ncbi:MAG: PIN domain-containing protein [Streptosporangiales bacterium]|nr:PIN domain-containing protein [Streptosporangiales bacterium]
MAVVDTSALVELFTVEAAQLDAALAERLATVIPHVPDILDVEFHHALRGLLLGNKISAERAEHARALFTESPKVRFPTRDMTERIWLLRYNLGAYDASFVVLAESLDVPLITCDDRQATASGHHALVEAFRMND